MKDQRMFKASRSMIFFLIFDQIIFKTSKIFDIFLDCVNTFPFNEWVILKLVIVRLYKDACARKWKLYDIGAQYKHGLVNN